MQDRYIIRLREDRFVVFDRANQRNVCFRDTIPEARHVARSLNALGALTVEEKAESIADALDQLAIEIAKDKERYDDVAAVLSCHVIDCFNSGASTESKARLYDIIRGA